MKEDDEKKEEKLVIEKITKKKTKGKTSWNIWREFA